MSDGTIDPRNNPESQQADEQADRTGTTAAGDSGVVMSDAPATDEGRHGVLGDRITGTDDGDLLGGIRTSDVKAPEDD